MNFKINTEAPSLANHVYPPSPRVSLADIKFNDEKTSSFFKQLDIFYSMLDNDNSGYITRESCVKKLHKCFEAICEPQAVRPLVRKQIHWLFTDDVKTLTKEQFVGCYRKALAAKVEVEILEMDVRKGIRVLKRQPYNVMFKKLDALLKLLDLGHATVDVEQFAKIIKLLLTSVLKVKSEDISDDVQYGINLIRGEERARVHADEFVDVYLTFLDSGIVTVDELSKDVDMASEEAAKIESNLLSMRKLIEPEHGSVQEIQESRHHTRRTSST